MACQLLSGVQTYSKSRQLSISLIKPNPTRISRKSAGKPPKLEIILIPSIPAKEIIIQEIAPIRIPQTALRSHGASWFSCEIPFILIADMAEVLESAAVT